MALPDLAALADLLALIGPAADSTKAQAALTAASRRFRAAVDHPVTLVEDDVVTLDSDGSAALLLPAAPVVDVTTVKVEGDTITDYDWSADGILRRRHGRWPCRLRSVEVTYTHGHPADAVPDDIREAVLNQAHYRYLHTPGTSSIQVGGQTVTTSEAAVTVGVTAGWDVAVANHRLNRGDRP